MPVKRKGRLPTHISTTLRVNRRVYLETLETLQELKNEHKRGWSMSKLVSLAFVRLNDELRGLKPSELDSYYEEAKQ